MLSRTQLIFIVWGKKKTVENETISKMAETTKKSQVGLERHVGE